LKIQVAEGSVHVLDTTYLISLSRDVFTNPNQNVVVLVRQRSNTKNTECVASERVVNIASQLGQLYYTQIYVSINKRHENL